MAMTIIDPIIDRVELLLGDTYNIRYNYTPIDDMYYVRVDRNDRDWHLKMIFSEHDLQHNQSAIAGSIATSIIRSFNEWVNTYGKDSKS